LHGECHGDSYIFRVSRAAGICLHLIDTMAVTLLGGFGASGARELDLSQTKGGAQQGVSGCDGLRLLVRAPAVAKALAHFEMPP
jgi:hypothetical protein